MSIGWLQGLGSSVPSIDQLVQQYMAIERRPLSNLDKVKDDLTVRSGMLTDLGNILTSLSTKLQAVVDTAGSGGFGAKKVTSQDTSVLTGEASFSAAPTSYSILVSQVARAHTVTSSRFDSSGMELSANPGTRTLVVDVGGSSEEISYSVESGQTNATVLNSVAQAIRSSGLGVSASVIAEAPGTTRLVLVSRSIGSAGAVSVSESFDEDELAGVSGLAYRAVRQGGTELTGGAGYTLDVVDYQPGVSATYRLRDSQGSPLSVYDPSTQGWNTQATVDLSGGDASVDTGRGLGFTISSAGGATGSAGFRYGIGLASARQMSEGSGGYETAADELDARFTLNGLAMVRSSNVITDAVDGVTLTLLKAQPGGAQPVGVSVAPDTGLVESQVGQFLTQFNATLAYLKVKTEINLDTKVRGPLHGEYGYVALKSTLRRLPSEQVQGTETLPYHNLRDIGITADDKGELSISDHVRFDQAVSENPGAVAELLGGTNGVAARLKQVLEPFTEPMTGQIARDQASVQARKDELDRRRVAMEERLKARELQLRLQWSRAYEALTVMLAQQQALSSMFSAWGIGSGSTSTM